MTCASSYARCGGRRIATARTRSRARVEDEVTDPMPGGPRTAVTDDQGSLELNTWRTISRRVSMARGNRARWVLRLRCAIGAARRLPLAEDSPCARRLDRPLRPLVGDAGPCCVRGIG